MPFRSLKLHILVIEDNPGDFFLIEEYLREEMHNLVIVNASSFSQAKEHLRTNAPFDTILLDLSLPDGRGERLVNDVVQLAGTSPVIVLTGYEDKNFGISTIALGISDYLLKDELNASQLYKSITYSIERKRINAKLNESEENYRNLFHLSPLPMFVFDIETYRFLNVNEAAIRHYGYSKEEFLSLTIKDIRPQEDVEYMEPTRESGIPYHGLVRHYKKDGELIQVEIKSNLINFEGKQARLVLANDITDKLKSEEQVRKTTQQLKTAQEIARLGYWEMDAVSQKIFWSDELYSIFGVDKNSYTPSIESFFGFIHPDDLHILVQSQMHKTKAEKHELEYRIICPDGTLKYIYHRGSTFFNDNGQPVRFEGIMQDVTQQKKEEEHLRLLESVITHTTDAVIITEAAPLDEPGPKILFVNDAFSSMTGYLKEEVLNKTPRFMHGPKTSREELNRLRRALENNQPCEIEIINYKKSGEEFWVNITVTPMTDSEGKTTHFIAIEKDVTERKRQDQEITKAIIRAQEDERRYVAGELHDNVNQILAGARIGLGMLKNAHSSEHLSIIEQTTQHIDKAIKEIRKLSHQLAPASLDDNSLHDIVEDLINVMNVDKKYAITLHFEPFEQKLIRKEIQLNLYRILQEQLNNIIKYADASQVEISFSVQNDHVRMRIYDNGKGFDVQNTKRGFGLSNMKKRTDLFMGSLQLSSSEGKGCEIIVELPLQ